MPTESRRARGVEARHGRGAPRPLSRRWPGRLPSAGVLRVGAREGWREARQATTVGVALGGGKMTVADGLAVGVRLYRGRRRLGMRGRPRAAAMALDSHARAMSQARTVRPVCKGWFKRLRYDSDFTRC